MTSRPTVLMLTDAADTTADRVAAELAMRGVPIARVDAADFPANVHLAADLSRTGTRWTGMLAGRTREGRPVDANLQDVVSVYYRRPTQFQLAEGMSGPERSFAYSEARRGFGGVLQGLGCLWVNDPVRVAAAEYKPLQLATAAQCGLRVPETIVTNDPERAAKWGENLAKPVVYKPMGGVWHPENGEVHVLYTSPVEEPAELRDPALALTAHLLQEWIDKTYEARVVIVGQQAFTVAIHARSQAGHLDWRADYGSHRYEVVELPAEVRDSLLALHERLGLAYGACDLAITPEGEWVFLETNPSGEWGWLAAECGLPIAPALAFVAERCRMSTPFDDEPGSRRLASDLARSLAEAGDIPNPAWEGVFARVPRHIFVPYFARTEHTSRGTYYALVSGTDADQHDEWLRAVYSNTTLLTQVEGQPVERILASGGGYGAHSSSSTAPGLMAWMLGELRIGDRIRVLEIGTGTGYNAALLCERLGSELVTTVDIDPLLVDRARERLARLGHHPALVDGDGRYGYPAHAPYDRIVATCSLPYLPNAWVAQTRPGGLILTNITGLLGGAMLLARVHDDGTASGRFLPRWAGFMCARPTGPRVADIAALDTAEGTYEVGTSSLSPDVLADPAFAFTAQLHTTDARPYWATHEDGYELYGLIAPDGSWAEIYPPGATGRRHVEQGGPRRLWNLLEGAHRFWTARGKPDWSRFGVTATPHHQYVWFDHPKGPAWNLPAADEVARAQEATTN